MLSANNPKVGNTAARRRFRGAMLRWYDRHRRDLPWRKDVDPYRVWLSEIMLQQTRVAAVIDHFHRFLKRFPTVEKLATAREASVLTAWSGLGYYRRARMLHAAAKKVVKQYGGRFPSNAQELRSLPGIGRYTAAALASIAFREPVAVVDGNVERVLTRLLGQHLAGENLWQAAQELLDSVRPGDFNQAMMELGATVCVPRQPKCAECPVVGLCATRGETARAAPSAPQRKRRIHYTFETRDTSVFLVQRSCAESLMPGMWELPESPANGETWLQLRHSITVTNYSVTVSRGPAPEGTPGEWVGKKRIATLPLTGLARKILKAAEF